MDIIEELEAHDKRYSRGRWFAAWRDMYSSDSWYDIKVSFHANDADAALSLGRRYFEAIRAVDAAPDTQELLDRQRIVVVRRVA